MPDINFTGLTTAPIYPPADLSYVGSDSMSGAGTYLVNDGTGIFSQDLMVNISEPPRVANIYDHSQNNPMRMVSEGNQLELKDIKVGDFVSVLYWIDNDRSYNGDVLEVIAINAPYVVVNRKVFKKDANLTDANHDMLNSHIQIDSRSCRFCSLTPEYVKAVSGIIVPEKPKFRKMTRYEIAKAGK